MPSGTDGLFSPNEYPVTAFPKYERYKDSGVEWLGEIPEHWEVRRNLGVFDERKECNQPEEELLY
jgi:type I restriction enzyme S subunit